MLDTHRSGGEGGKNWTAATHTTPAKVHLRGGRRRCALRWRQRQTTLQGQRSDRVARPWVDPVGKGSIRGPHRWI